MNNTVTLDAAYVAERGEQGKLCTSGTDCNDEIERTYTWTGKVGLIYPSDFGYASGNSVCKDNIRSSCDTTWMGYYGYTITPAPNSSNARGVWYADIHNVSNYGAFLTSGVRPAVYLISGIQMKPFNPNDTTNAAGSQNNPYVFAE